MKALKKLGAKFPTKLSRRFKILAGLLVEQAEPEEQMDAREAEHEAVIEADTGLKEASHGSTSE